jgi:type I restriction enzyme, R subunit
VKQVSSKAELYALEEKLLERDQELENRLKAQKDYEAEIQRFRAEIADAKRRNQTIPVEHDYSEAETRDAFIDLLLREVGWNPDFSEGELKTHEFPVPGMPNRRGEGLADYVLWGDDGKPLGVIEAKKTRRDARVGQHQAKLYAADNQDD